ncbi:MAG: TerC family protein [Gammaproteobacteria bacterium]|nr:TerC family protein [Gammaproteobacteria bacterium]MDE1887127.1 TerC family protein [Gammaproteobacteria bacterium]MDE2022925.1 TerC family protein [Gammaproteobacteria bacterium]MDE2139461.1 TerC family protein [Gammaproteobacteria bacterium]MDE2274613.1 TerC family protein [Gammaproteobacteria bacterium]
MEWITDPNIWAALVTLTALEIVLGIDNIIFISIVTGGLPAERQASARRTGLILAVVTRLLLLASIFWLSRLTRPLFTLFEQPFSVRDLVLIGGGLFLLAKSTLEIHGDIDQSHTRQRTSQRRSFFAAVTQILLLDVVFSLDSVITAIGMSDKLAVMAAAIIIAVGFMLMYAGAVSRFVQRHPTLKMLALAFLVLIGVALIADGLGMHIPKGYIYFSMAFAFGVEMLNLQIRKRRAP